jgi:predicted DNA-binding helix-hairpin-helix protein
MNPEHAHRIDLNAASERELTQLPHVGVDRARKIVHSRTVRQGFRDWEDFAKSLGLTEQDVEAIRSRAWLGPAAKDREGGSPPRRASRDTIPVRGPRPRPR